MKLLLIILLIIQRTMVTIKNILEELLHMKLNDLMPLSTEDLVNYKIKEVGSCGIAFETIIGLKLQLLTYWKPIIKTKGTVHRFVFTQIYV